MRSLSVGKHSTSTAPLEAGAHAHGGWRVLDLIRVSTEFLASKGVDSPRLTAELLLVHALDCKRIDLYTRFDQITPPAALDRFRELIRQRAGRRPTQYLLGRCEFMSLEFAVNEHVLIPRPETELLVEAACRHAAAMASPRVADVGAGCGCIGLALAHRATDARVFLTDISEPALRVARANAKALGVDARAAFLHGDLFEPIEKRGLRAGLDMVASNPPYVAAGEFETLPPEVRDHEPRLALDGGPDGLDFYRRFVTQAPDFLKPSGFLLLEMPDGRANPIRSLVDESATLDVVEIIKDYGRVERVLVAQRPAVASS